MARTDYGAILSTVIKDTSDAIREVNDTSSLIAPNQWGTQIRTMHSDSDYQNVLSGLEQKTISDVAVASFTDGLGNIDFPSLKVAITPVQASGTPSPSNPLPISGWSAVNITVNDDLDNPQTENEYLINLGGTYYGGVLDVTRGKLVVTKTAKKFNDITNIQQYSGYTGYFIIEPVNDKALYNANVISEIYKTVPVTTAVADMPNYSIRGVNQTTEPYINRFFVRDSRYTTTSQFLEGVGNTLICYDLRNPIEIDLTPTQIAQLNGNNNVFADSGNVNECKYYVNANLS